MKTLLLGMLLVSTPSLAAECYQSEANPSWTVEYEPRPVDAEKPVLVWKRDGEVINMGTYGVGTALDGLMAAPLDDTDGTSSYSFDVRDDGALILDKKIYRLGCN